MNLKIEEYTVYIFNGRNYTQNLIDKIFPIYKNYDYPIYSISLDGKIKKEIPTDTFLYPFFPIFEMNKFFVNPIHLQLIDIKNVLPSIQKNIQFILSKGVISKKSYKPKSFISIKVTPDEIPYKETNHGWLSIGTKSSLYTISKCYSLKNIVEFGTWYGNSAEYIKKYNPDSKLLCFDVFRSILESEYTPKGYGIDKFYTRYPRLESVFKRMQKFDNVELVKGDASNGLEYLSNIKVKPDMIFIDFIKNKDILFSFLMKIHKYYPNSIIIGDDYVFNPVKISSRKFYEKYKDEYQFITNENSYILIPNSKYIPEIKSVMEKKFTTDSIKYINNKYTQCYFLIKELKFKEAIEFVQNENLHLNFKSKVLPNDSTLYHMFAYFLRTNENKEKYLKLLFKIEEPKKITNNFDLTFEDMLKFDSSRLFSG